tara:strand:+ start:323 stop:1081 length:759 start_codon:yes stop_codon:yes gene_type:complete
MAMPRSGNTLFASIMNQNPKVACTANSITLEIMKDLFLLKQTDVFKNYQDHQSLDNVLSSVYYNYYKDWSQDVIIDRGPAMTEGNFMLLKKHLGQPVKCIVLWRDLLDVLASFIKWFENEPTAYPHKYGKKNIEEKLFMLMSDKGSIAKELRSIQAAMKPENQKNCFFIRYEDLVTQPEPTIKGIYEFLEMDYYSHRYHSLDQFNLNGLGYDDTDLGKNLHTIKTKELKLEENPYKKMIPQSIIDEYGHIRL